MNSESYRVFVSSNTHQIRSDVTKLGPDLTSWPEFETALLRSQNHLLSLQKPEGYWVGELIVDSTLVSDTVADGATISVGDVELRAVHLVGHTPGSIALVYDDPTGPPHVFTGDCLFPGGVGNTQKDAARFASLYADVSEKLFGALPDETWVYPGHGKDTTIGAERPHLDEWRERGW